MLNLTNLFDKTQNDYLKTKYYFIKMIYYIIDTYIRQK
ncbi:hypothetical protein HMPREF1143_1671 [Peptoanaerobacter stomatis]|uniref:Uncharacterized protein n=1 Tax=Peptoanaerobacter stomatis TaxID=796937 RepID=J6HAY1_9FIRM|nr:hypothetical protein HMPREF1143_1671 [Peptoanaerobacter stomatis]